MNVNLYDRIMGNYEKEDQFSKKSLHIDIRYRNI
jgi:hypothetical protein